MVMLSLNSGGNGFLPFNGSTPFGAQNAWKGSALNGSSGRQRVSSGVLAARKRPSHGGGKLAVDPALLLEQVDHRDALLRAGGRRRSTLGRGERGHVVGARALRRPREHV